jgi:hypothetical protein
MINQKKNLRSLKLNRQLIGWEKEKEIWLILVS